MSLSHFPFVNSLINVSESAMQHISVRHHSNRHHFSYCIPLIHLIVLNPLIAPYTKDKKQILIFKQVGAKPPKCPQGLGKKRPIGRLFFSMV